MELELELELELEEKDKVTGHDRSCVTGRV